MLYERSKETKLDLELFRSPSAEYRGAPFWAWNCRLNRNELEWQIDVLKKMGFGGAHIHVRTGLETPYLGEEFLDLVKNCVSKAKSREMLTWLYDEDRWPSGAAGGLVTKDKKYRARYLLFTPYPYSSSLNKKEKFVGSSAKSNRAENGILLACYDIELDANGKLSAWKIISEEDKAQNEKWYAYLEVNEASPWFNNQTYVNTLDKAAIDRFIDITYNRYQQAIGEEFGRTIPAIFTDEPQFSPKTTLSYPAEKGDVILPWTDDLPDSFSAAYSGEDILAGLPELIWERADGRPSVLRYHYHDHVCERFANAFADNCGNWCKAHGLLLTGHMMAEDTLKSQTGSLGEAMRSYRSFGIPGIDMLCASFQYNTAKQAQSAVHQYAREGMASELYGVTNWDFDFRGHKLHGDWQAALGVTVRVPHLSWVSMAGEAKRDYPASINYQSPWWEKYGLIEDHFARLNTAMTRGKPLVKVGIIHPIESYWLHWGPAEQTALARDKLESNFKNLTEWLLFGSIDFDFISESLLPDLCNNPGAPLQVGAMKYDVIVIPDCETLRATTVERLESFCKNGGKLIFAGEIPAYVDARESDRCMELSKVACCIPFSRSAVLEALEDSRVIEIRDQSGLLTNDLLHQIRADDNGLWLFICHGKNPYNKNISRSQDLMIRVKGKWQVSLYNTLSGKIEEVDQSIIDENTEIARRVYEYDSLLLRLEPNDNTEDVISDKQTKKERLAVSYKASDRLQERHIIAIPAQVPYTLSEPNAMLLDQAEYSLDGEEWQTKEEILRLDARCRKILGWPDRGEHSAQPWVVKPEQTSHVLRLRWHIFSMINYVGAQLAIENADVKLSWNGKQISNAVVGWYADKSITTVSVPEIKQGDNILEAIIPFGRRTNVEWAYLLGNFGVDIAGQVVRIIDPRQEIAFGSITTQGLPFYGGNITYHIPIDTEAGTISMRSSQYSGVMQEACLDGGELHPMIYSPYVAELGKVKAGYHAIDLTLYGHRRNGFGPVHLTDLNNKWIGPSAWRSTGERWCYEYMLCEEGIMTAPEIYITVK